MILSAIVAVSDNDVMAKDGKIPWFVRGEQLIFKRLTTGPPIIMGRKTFETPKTLKDKPMLLPDRLNIVISRNKNYKVPEGGVVVNSFDEALALPAVKSASEAFVIGGSEIFEQAMPKIYKLYLTRVHTTIADGDKFFKFNPGEWKLTHKEFYKKNEVPDRPYDFEFQIWQRRP
nr:dihydrofolate reductase [uncultured bacterium]